MGQEGVCQLFRREKPRSRLQIQMARHPFTCTEQLAPSSLRSSTDQWSCVKTPRFKCATIIPVPQKSSRSGLNSYRPVAVTSVVIKTPERLLLSQLKDITGPLWWTIRTTERIVEAKLPCIQDWDTSRVRQHASSFPWHTQPAADLWKSQTQKELPPSGHHSDKHLNLSYTVLQIML